MQKVIICPHRHPSMSRSEFFVHLEQKHAPLVLGEPAIMRYLRRYIQNHTRIGEDGWAPGLDFAWRQDRDSVIELWYDSLEALSQATSEPGYLANIRPDEERFNDLSTVVLLFVQEEEVFSGDGVSGPAKVFDFVSRRAGVSADEFAERWRDFGTALAADATYRNVISKRIHNVAVRGDDAAFARAAAFDGVAESWLSAPAEYEQADVHTLVTADFIDASRSFSVVALERPILDP